MSVATMERPMTDQTKERLVRYLDDAWGVEKTLVSTLETMANEVNDPQLKAALMEHREVTHQQEENLEARIRALGEEPTKTKGFFNGMMAKLGDMMQVAHDDYDKTTRDLMKAFATENFEIAMYTSLESYATAIGDTETASLAQRHLQEEREAADKVFPFIAPAAARAVNAAGT